MANSVTFPIGLGGSGQTIDDSSNPGTGLGSGGHRTLFVPCLSQTVIMSQTAVTYAGNSLTYSNNAAASATLAANHATYMSGFVPSTSDYSAKYYAAQAAASAAAALGNAPFTDTNPIVQGSVDSTKRARFEVDGLTTATTRVYTLPNKDGTVAMIDDTSLVLLATVTPTAVNAIDIDGIFSATYSDYIMHIDGILPDTSGSNLFCRFFIAGVVDTGANYANISDGSSTAPGGTTNGTVMSDVANSGVGTQAGLNVRCDIMNCQSSRPKTIHSSAAFVNSANSLVAATRKVHYIGTSAASGIRLYWSAGNFTNATGRIRVYGLKA